jgi:hypothetical protein
MPKPAASQARGGWFVPSVLRTPRLLGGCPDVLFLTQLAESPARCARRRTPLARLRSRCSLLKMTQSKNSQVLTRVGRGKQIRPNGASRPGESNPLSILRRRYCML